MNVMKVQSEELEPTKASFATEKPSQKNQQEHNCDSKTNHQRKIAIVAKS